MGFDFSPAWISIKVTLTATAIVFFLGLVIAWLMTNYNGRWKGLIDGILTLPLVLPPTVAGFGILLLIGKNGPIGNFLEIFGVNIIFSWYAAVIAAVVVAFPLMYKTTMGAFEQIDPNILSAARTLGASEVKVFWRVAVPVARPGIAAATALTFARCLGEFGATLMVAGSIPGKTETIPIAIYFATQGGEMQVALIWVLIIFAISLTVLVINNYWESRKKKQQRGFGG
ncbi:molybdate ABC transporter permease subunit [Acetobacterium wieringae]|jgi:molybdate transport system permease protein|uniref:Molybdenum transport system permease n=1 Tax=Acetobacterium wieringae TaxID=52694 RepID=A0A1F2PMC8_9FIRM|nr:MULTISPECIES: molybdate ABC transporter permease subunit [Acetobacterium]MEA4804559.1 molybdate ABC transporter permease subunit [Acetobacterium wieringae]OFV71902.1 molybdenum transport system permease protein ModB [Acetobacterium wieringae]OXS24797.1 MAG: molybdenum ABC transporter permease subunit [Acetobacterium sp. MES1]TYC85723.1 molybdate ABC transporter permease subunit [Acetobacterium wieringae]URN85109.1 molybdate ABC transporter permease subunit [Acetobacterium wieringae]